jgi:hypothetical protein
MNDKEGGSANDEQRNVTAEAFSYAGKKRLRLRSCGGANSDFRLVKLLFRLGANLVEFGVKTTQFGVELDETQAMRRDQSFCRHSSEILLTTRFQVNAGGRLLCTWIFLQVQKIEICGLHDRIMPRPDFLSCEYFLTRYERNKAR